MTAGYRVAVDDCWPTGGIGTFAGHVLTGLEQLGHRLDRLSHTASPRVAARTPIRPIAVSRMNRRGRASSSLFFNPGFYPPLRWNGPAAVTVHDLQYLDPATNPSWKRRQYFQQVLVPLLARCELLLTVSDESAAEIEELIGAGPAVRVVGNGVDDAFFIAGKSRSCPDRGPLDRGVSAREPFRVTYIGNWLAHKRADLLIAAAAEASRSVPIELSLPSGPPQAISFVVRSVVDDPDCDLTVTIRADLEREQLASHVADSDLLLLLSTREGFGLPPLEAQAARTPVLVSDFSGARDRLGSDGAHFVDVAADAEEIGRRLVELMDNPLLCKFTVEGGVRNAESRRWVDVVQRVDLALRELV